MGNGFVITEKGKRVLAENPAPKKRKKSEILKQEKTCPECKLLRSINEFVTIYGVKNPRAKYCIACFALHQKQHAMSLMEGRDFCLYCGQKVEKVYDWTPDGKSDRVYLDCDHMDPLSLGGEDSERNTVYCCVKCNLRKGNRPYTEWLMELEPECRIISLGIYMEKHGRSPEDFKPLEPYVITHRFGKF